MYESPSNSKSSQIATAIERDILANEYKQGDMLPSQKELADKYNASSRSLREAFKALEAKGLIEVSQGKRAVVKSNNLDQFVESLSISMISKNTQDKKLIADLLDVHTTLEVNASRALSRRAERVTIARTLDNYLERMERCVDEYERSGNQNLLGEYKKLDFDFHVVIINSNDNIILKSIYNSLSPQLFSVMEKVNDSEADRRKSIRELHYLSDAIRKGQTDLAVALTLVCTTNLAEKFNALYS